MGKIAALWNLFRVGESVDNPGAWKTGQITATVLAPVIVASVAVAKAYGYAIPIDNDAALSLAGGVIVVVNVVLTLTTSKHIGIAPAKANGRGVAGESAAVPAAGSDEGADGAGDPAARVQDERAITTRTDPFGGEHGA